MNDLVNTDASTVALSILGGSAFTYVAMRFLGSLKETPQALVHHLLARRLSTFETTFARVDEARNASANKIWTLTGAFNLFGPPNPVDLEQLQTDLRDWYFEHGQMMTEGAKLWYFLTMEVLGALSVYGVNPQRPPERQLYAGYANTLAVLRAELSHIRQALGTKVTELAEKNTAKKFYTSYQGRIGQPRLDRLVVELKIALQYMPHKPETATLAWLTTQELMSRLRGHLVRDLGWRGKYAKI